MTTAPITSEAERLAEALRVLAATPQQVRLPQHTPGLGEHQCPSYRNHSATSAGTTDFPDLEALPHPFNKQS